MVITGLVVNDNMLLSARNAVLEADNEKAVEFWAKQQDDKNALILRGFNSDEADEFIAHACMDYYVYATENNK